MSIVSWKKKEAGSVPVAQSTEAVPFVHFRTEMDRLFDRFFGESSPLSGAGFESFKGWHPSLNVAEDDEEVVITAEVPGLEPKEIDISLSGNILTIQGEKKEEKEEEKGDYRHVERRFGSFKRSVELPSTANLDDIAAEHKNGLLKIKVRKTEAAKPKTIPVR